VVSVLIFTSPDTELPAVFSGSWGLEIEAAANGHAAFVCRRCGGNLKVFSSQKPTVGIGVDIKLIPRRLKWPVIVFGSKSWSIWGYCWTNGVIWGHEWVSAWEGLA
jgi:hypothetical protein